MKSRKWLKAILASRSSEERSLCMKRIWRTKRRVMLAGVRKHISKNQKMGVEAAHKHGAVSKALKKKWKEDPDFAKMVIEKNLAQGRLHPSKVQIRTKRLLQKETGLKLVSDYPVERYNIDIADVKRKRGLELDGSYWHDLRTRNSKRRRRRVLKKLGWTILTIRFHRKRLNCSQYERCKTFLQ